jgi:2-amino-4-hydroxy-6-hydroxymethyldihydropteridine diphosphokinase
MMETALADPQSTRAFLGLGGNLGNPAATMKSAIQALHARDDVTVETVSSLYRTPPWGKLDQPDFINAVAAVRTRLAPHQLLELCLEIERMHKRERRERWGPRPIDLDVLLYGEEELQDDQLQIPHPRMAERAFVLVPLLELAPKLVIKGKPAAELLLHLDRQGIEKITPDGSWWRA